MEEKRYRTVEGDATSPDVSVTEPTQVKPVSDKLDEIDTKLDLLLKAIGVGDAS